MTFWPKFLLHAALHLYENVSTFVSLESDVHSIIYKTYSSICYLTHQKEHNIYDKENSRHISFQKNLAWKNGFEVNYFSGDFSKNSILQQGHLLRHRHIYTSFIIYISQRSFQYILVCVLSICNFARVERINFLKNAFLYERDCEIESMTTLLIL